MRKTPVVACFSLLIAAATIIIHQESVVGIRAAIYPPEAWRRRTVSEQPAVGKQLVMETYGRLPLSFEANHGQTDASVKFLSRGNGYTLFLTATEAVLALRKPQESGARSQEPESERQSEPRPRGSGGLNPSRARQQAARTGATNNPQITPIAPIVNPETSRSSLSVKSAKSVDQESFLRMELVGANPNPEVVGEDELPGKSNYFLGNDPSKWRTNVPTYAKVRYTDVYPGIDLVYYGNQRQLEYDLVVAPGADPRAIRLAFPSRARKQAVNPNGDPPRPAGGVDRERAVPLRIDAQGDLVLEADGSELRLHQPVIYQEINGTRQSVGGNFVISDATAKEGARQVGFEVARYDASKPLIIDPVLSYSTYLGGSNTDEGYGIAVDSSGSVYITGRALSTNFPRASPFQSTYGGGFSDAFVAKLNASGSALVYSTYLGGSGDDEGRAIALDSSGNAYVTGFTGSTNFPTANAFQPARGGQSGTDAFVTKLNAAGSALVYSTYLGGLGSDEGRGIAVDSSGNAYVTGRANSPNFPTAAPLQAALRGSTDAFITKFNAAGSALVYSTFLGGSTDDSGSGIALDSSGNAYITGRTLSTNFPTANAFQATFGGGSAFFEGDAFVTKMNAAGSALVYSTYLGGSGADSASGIAVDSSGNAHVAGSTTSTNFPTTPGAFQNTLQSTDGVFVAKLNATGSTLLYSTHLGGSGQAAGNGIAVDSFGNAYVTGNAYANFPTVDPLQAVHRGFGDVVVAILNASGSALLYSTYLGGNGDDEGHGITVDSSGNVYVVGHTISTNFPTANPLQPTLNAVQGDEHNDAFIAKIQVSDIIGSGGGGGGGGTAPAFSSSDVKNNASYALTVAPGAIVAIFGSGLTDGTSCLPPSCNPTFGSNGRLNTTMAGAQASVNGTPVPIFYAIPGQLGIQIPTELTGASATVQVSVGGQSSPAVTVQVEPLSPGIFTFTSDGRGAGAFTHVNGSPVSPQNPARPGELVILYATGLGQVSPAVATGALPGGESRTVSSATVSIDGISVIPDFAGLAGCCVGLNQINVRVPASTRTANDIPVVLSVGGKQSNPVTIAVQ
jgi:uncharacterized protein (TIGR03437 family)